MNNTHTTSAHLALPDMSLLYPLDSSTGNSLDLNLSHNTVTAAQAQPIPSYNTALFGSMPAQSYTQPLYPHLTTDPQQTLMTLHQQYQHQCLQQYLQQQQLQLAQQQIMQQQQNIQLALQQHQQQQQIIPVLTTPMSSHLPTFPEPLGLLNCEGQWPSWSTEVILPDASEVPLRSVKRSLLTSLCCLLIDLSIVSGSGPSGSLEPRGATHYKSVVHS